MLQSGGRAWPPFLFYRHKPWQWNLALARVLTALTAQKRAPASNSNSGACYASVLSRPAALPGWSVLSESELAKLQQVLSDADACAVAVITAWYRKLWRTSGDLKDLDKLGIDIETSLAVIALASPPVDSVVTVIRAPIASLAAPGALVLIAFP